MYLQYIRSFYYRRLRVPVNRQALVLDIGGGNLPNWRADVVCEKSTRHDKDRSHGASAMVCPGLVLCEIENLPFADKQFDWGICSHVLEHVDDPEKAIAEYVRCCKAGLLATPREAFEKLHGWDAGHKWYVRLEQGVLVFTQKTKHVFDPEIARFIQQDFMPTRQWRSFYLSHAEKFETRLVWKDKIAFKVNCSNVAPGIMQDSTTGNFLEQGGCGPRRLSWLYQAFRTLARFAAGLRTVNLRALLVCPKCKGLLSKDTACPNCDLRFPCVNGIYDMRVK